MTKHEGKKEDIEYIGDYFPFLVSDEARDSQKHRAMTKAGREVRVAHTGTHAGREMQYLKDDECVLSGWLPGCYWGAGIEPDDDGYWEMMCGIIASTLLRRIARLREQAQEAR